jgi:hypothetical protein
MFESMGKTVHMPWYYHTPTLSDQAIRVAGFGGMQCCRGRQGRKTSSVGGWMFDTQGEWLLL